MADIQPAASGRKPGGKRRSKKIPFRLDMTPMVDLAFLLLTFFMLTTTFAKSSTMELQMPAPGKPSPAPASKAMTIILGKNHQVYYYFGLNDKDSPAKLKATDFSAYGIRKVIVQRQRQAPFIALIKPSREAKYQDMVNILDEMNITHQQKYALVKIGQADADLISRAD